MKIKIEIEDYDIQRYPDERAEFLRNKIFEVCEDWVMRGIEPTCLTIEGQ